MRLLWTLVIGTTLLAVAPTRVQAQQFNSDNYMTMPHGTGTFVLTTGTEYSALMSSFALLPRWEFFYGAFLAWEDPAGGEAEIGIMIVTPRFLCFKGCGSD